MELFISTQIAKYGCHSINVVNAGAFSIRPSVSKSYLRLAIALTLEQIVFRDAASPIEGTTAFRNSDSAVRKLSITSSRSVIALSELRELVGFREGDDPASQLRTRRIKRDNFGIDLLYRSLQQACNPCDYAF